MIIPKFIQEGDIIAVTAPSDGNKNEIDYTRLTLAKSNLKKRGIEVIETLDVRRSVKGRSESAIERAKEIGYVFAGNDVKAVISAKGGDFLMEILPYVDFDLIRKNPKWFQGFSDNTGLGFLITTLCDTASIYSSNFNDFAMDVWNDSLKANWNVLTGKSFKQHSFDRYQDGFIDYETGSEGYSQDKDVKWINARDEEHIELNGRFLGGCLDVLLNLVGTRFDKVSEFIEKYRDDGIIWFLESFSLSSEAIERGLWQLSMAGWFDTARGFVFGRPAFFSSDTDTSYKEAVLNALGKFSVPIILEADIGHKPPQLTMINGMCGKLVSENGKGFVEFFNE